MHALDSFSAMLAYLAQSLAYLGHMDQARAQMNQAISEARRLGHAHTLAAVLTYACRVEWIAGSPHHVQAYANEIVALSNEHGFPLFLGYGRIFYGWSLGTLGVQESLALLTKGITGLGSVGAVLCAASALMMYAESYAKLERPVEGLDCLSEAAQIVETTDERFNESELYRLRAGLLSVTGDEAAAEQDYCQALVVAKRQSAKMLELRAAIGLARLSRDQGRHIEARDLLAPIYGWFTEGFDTPVLTEAKVLLDQLA
jgi:predicted ATPase